MTTTDIREILENAFQGSNMALCYSKTHARNVDDTVRAFEEVLRKLLINFSGHDKLSIYIPGCGDGAYDVIPLLKAIERIANMPVELLAIDNSIPMLSILEEQLTKLTVFGKSTEKSEGLYTFKNEYSRASASVKVICADVEKYFFEETMRFHLVVCFMVLHHLTNYREFLQNILQHLYSFGFLLYDQYEESRIIFGTDGVLDGKDLFGNISQFQRQREFEEGIFWDPELKGTDYSILRALLSQLGSGIDEVGKTSMELEFDKSLLNEALSKGLYGQLWWGSRIDVSGRTATCFNVEATENYTLPVKTVIYSWQKPEQRSGNKSIDLPEVLGQSYWLDGLHVTRCQNHMALPAEQYKSANLDKISRLVSLKFLQYLIFSGCLTASTVAVSPILLPIKKLDTWALGSFQELYSIVKTDQRKEIANRYALNVFTLCTKFDQESPPISLTSLIHRELQKPLIIKLLPENIENVSIEYSPFGITSPMFIIKLPITLFSQFAIDTMQDIDENIENVFTRFCFLNIERLFYLGESMKDKIKTNVEICKKSLSRMNIEAAFKSELAGIFNIEEIEKLTKILLATIPRMGYLLNKYSVTVIPSFSVRFSKDKMAGVASLALIEEQKAESKLDAHRYRLATALLNFFSAPGFMISLISKQEEKDDLRSLLDRINYSLEHMRALAELKLGDSEKRDLFVKMIKGIDSELYDINFCTLKELKDELSRRFNINISGKGSDNEVVDNKGRGSIKHFLVRKDCPNTLKEDIFYIMSEVARMILEGIKKLAKDDINQKHLDLFKKNLDQITFKDSVWFPIMGEVNYKDLWKYYLDKQGISNKDNIILKKLTPPLLMPFFAYALGALFAGGRKLNASAKIDIDIHQDHGRTVMTVSWTSTAAPVIRKVKHIIDDPESSFEEHRLAGRLLFLNNVFPNVDKSDGFNYASDDKIQYFSLCL